MKEMFTQIHKPVEISLTPKQKIQKLKTDIGGGWYIEKSARGLPSLNRTKLSEKSQEREDEIQKKLYEAKRWWNDCKPQVHWNKLEWIDPKSKPKRVKPFYIPSKNVTLVKVIEQLIFLAILD